MVDDADYEGLKQYKWHALYDCSIHGYYAVRKIRTPEGKRSSYAMHRQILGLRPGDPLQGDHINHDTLDNRRKNLRIVTDTQNQLNKRRPNPCGFRGITFNNWEQAWEARITVNGKRIRLGYRDTPEAAYRELYAPAALKYHGEFACVA